ncbi:MAG TPA: Gfo/Idh/MocA family oxidoreductase [Armatimonadota bacterium]|nr:Gfo/Idh/MocA family oxidoreductase [Armatimonadota bacterium]
MAEGIVNWGIISSAEIGQKALVPAIAAARNARLVCLGTPNPARIQETAGKYGYRIAPSYEAVLEDPEVQAIYNPLPNGMHALWTIRALQAGKHVLCEKPFTVTPAEVPPMIDAARAANRWLMEAFMYRFHPQMDLAKRVLDSGRIGALRMIRASFTFNSTPDPSNPRFQRDQGPGALLDVGCYCVNAIRHFSGGAPAAVSAWATWHEASGADMTTAGLLEYETHAGLFDCSFESTGRAGIEVVGDQGRIEIPRPWLPGTEPAAVLVWDKNGCEELKTEGVNHYQLMVEHFSDCILNHRPPARGPEDALENMRVLEALRRSAREKRRVSLGEV